MLIPPRRVLPGPLIPEGFDYFFKEGVCLTRSDIKHHIRENRNVGRKYLAAGTQIGNPAIWKEPENVP